MDFKIRKIYLKWKLESGFKIRLDHWTCIEKKYLPKLKYCKNKKVSKNEQSFNDLADNAKECKICVTVVSEREREAWM